MAQGSLTAARTLLAAAHPGAGATFAQLRRFEGQARRRAVRSGLVAVLTATTTPAAMAVTGLIAEALAALAPGRVAVLDADGAGQPQRMFLGADGTGDLRRMISSPQAWRVRRSVERFVAHGRVPVATAAVHERGRPFRTAELHSALLILRRRYPVVVAGASARLPPDVVGWTSALADHVVIAVSRTAWSVQLQQWTYAYVGRRSPEEVTYIMVPDELGALSGNSFGPYRGVALGPDRSLAVPGPVGLSQLRLGTLAGIERVVERIGRR